MGIAARAATLTPEQSAVGLVETESQYSVTPFKTRFTEDCVIAMTEMLPDAGATPYKLGCKIEDAIDKLEKDPQPGLQVLALRLILEKIKTNKDAFRREALEHRDPEAAKKKLSVFDGLFLKTLPVQTALSFEKLEQEFADSSKAYVEAAKKIYAMPDKVLTAEKAYFMAQIFGEALYFSEFITFMAANPRSELRHEAVAWAANWYERYQSGKATLRSWLFEKALAQRDTKVSDATTERDLFYWLLSLELQQPEEVRAQKKEILKTLRALWVNFPADESAQKIRRSADLIGLGRDFSPPGINQMDFSENLLRAQALLKKMDYEGAQKSLRRVWSFDSKNYPASQAFEALQLHIKILRYADARPKIPDVIKKYLDWAPEIYNPKAPGTELASHLSRGLELARAYWTYSDADTALKQIEDLIEIGRKSNLTGNIPILLYLRARVVEQKASNREAALGFFEEALKTALPQDMKTDLIWRYFYLHFEKASPSGNLTPLFSILDRIKKELPGQDDARLLYWQGKVFTLGLSQAKNKEAAKKQFLRAYDAEPFSFYSNLAGLELSNLGVTPKAWIQEKGDNKLFAPLWANYVSSHGDPLTKEFSQLARLYHLSKIGERSLATKAFSDVDKSVWTYLMSSKNSEHNKTQFGQAIAWLRFSLGDAMGGLRVAEVLRVGLKGKLGAVEQSLLYPLPYWDDIKSYSEKFGANPWLAASLIRQESAFNPRAKSFANALGLMQMIPPVAALEAKRLNIEDFTNEMLYNPRTALQLGTFHLGGLIKSFEGSWICAVASYNAGQPPVRKWVQFYSSSHPLIFIERISYAETRNYVKSILRNYINYQRIYGKGTIDTASLFELPSAEGKTPIIDEKSKGDNPAAANSSPASPPSL